MKNLKFLFVLLVIVPYLYAQSTITIGRGSSISISNGSDVSAGNRDGTLTSAGTFNSRSITFDPVATSATSITSISFYANWNASAGANGYKLDVSADPNFGSFITGYQNLDVGNVNTFNVNSGLSGGLTYYYRVRAYDVDGITGYSNVITVTLAPPSPVETAATNKAEVSFSANWNSSVGATGYKLDVSTDSNFGAGSFVAGFQNKDVGNVTTYSVTSLSGGTTYYYRIRSYNANGESANSGTITVLTIPIPPTALAASSLTQTSFVAEWQTVSSATGYRLDVSTDAAFAAGTFVSGFENIDVANVLSYSVNSNLTAGTTYYYRIRASNASGTSGNSNSISLITISPNPVSAAATNFTTASFNTNWNASTGAAKYYLDVSTDAAFGIGTFVTGYENLDVGNVITYLVNTNLSAGTTYYFRVRANNTSGTSGNSAVITAMTLSTAPVATSASAITQTSFNANWNASGGAEKYYLDVATDNTFSSYVTGYQNKDVGAVTTYTVNTNLTAGTTYYYRIRAFNISGNSSNSNVISLVTIPANPTSTAGTNVTGTSFDINWNSVGSATGYKLDVSTDIAFGAGNYLAGFEDKDVGNVVTFSMSGLSENTNYYYRVRAYNVSGTSGNSGIITVLTAPTIPVAIAATTIAASSFNANWNASLGAAKYYLDVATDNGFTSYVVGYQNKDVGNVITYNINGLSSGTTYFYRVRANNAGGTSGSSNTITLATIPGAPTATAATLVVSTSFSSNWNSVTGATGYKLDISTDINFSTHLAGYNDLDVGNVTTYSVTGLNSNTTYYYRVEAYNNYGTGANSGVITVLTTPSAVVATSATTIQTISFTSNWDALVGVSGYYLDVATDNGFTSYVVGYQNRDVGNVTSLNIPGLTSGTNYYYRVRAYNGTGAGNNSNVISLITLPSSPLATNATTITTSSFDANWNASVGTAKYFLDVATDNGFTNYVTGYQNKDVGNVTTLSISGLTSGTNYYYRVRANNASGTSANSNTIGLITLPAAPIAMNATTITTSSFDANWNASVGAVKYYLDVATDNGFTSFVVGYQNKDVGNVTTFNINGLATGTNFYYRVRAYNASGTSTNSNVINLITMPIAPVTTNATTITTSSFDANWNTSVGAAKYYLDVATDNGFTSYLTGYQNKDVGNVTTYNIGGLAAGTNYYYRVRAFNASGTSVNSNTIGLITLPTAPVATAATVISQNSFSANWNASVGSAKYYLDVATDNTFSSYVAGYQNKDVGNVITYNINGLSAGITYYYRVRANNAGGTSGSSNSITLATVPANPTVTAATLVISTSFSSNWNSVTGATGYKLDVSTVSNFTSYLAGYNNLDVGNVTTYSVTGLNPNTTYYYRLRAYNNYGESGNSGVITVLTTPSAVVATSATSIQTASFTSNWDALVGVSGYYLDVATDNGFTGNVAGYQNRDVGNVTSLNIPGLTSGTNYYYRVRAYNGTGAGNNSNVISLITLPSAPLATNATTITTSSFDANWNASTGATKYFLDVSTDIGFTSYVAGYQNKDVGNVTTLSLASLISGTNYYYRVRAFNISGTSVNSNTIGLITLPVAPVAANATTITTSSFDANWNASGGAAKYYIDVATDNGFTSYVVGYQNKDVGNVTTLALTGLSSGIDYYYRIRAFNASGASSNSNTINLITVASAPVAINATNVSQSGFDANWNTSVGAAKYYLDVATDNGFTSFVTGYQNKDVGNVTTLALPSLSSGTNYYYRVRAFNASGTSVNSNTIGLITLPAAPVATSATAITTSSFDANWNASVGAVKYYLDVATDNGFISYVVGYQNRDVGNVTTFNIAGLSSGTNYYYRIRSFNASGTSANSNTIGLITLPAAPVALNATTITTSSFDANWSASVGTSKYYLDVATDNGFTSYLTGYQNKDVGNVRTLSLSGLTSGTNYYYRVRAFNASGTSTNSNTIELVTPPGAAIATNATNITTSSFDANWNASIGAAKYYLDVATDNGFTGYLAGYQNKDVGNVTTLALTSLTTGTNYYYRVRAFNTSGLSSNSNVINLITVPSAPVAINAANVSQSGFDANWGATVGAAKYFLDVATDIGFTNYITGYQNKDVGNVITFALASLTSGTNYYYRVRAYNASGTSINSNTIGLITLSAAPIASNATTITTTSFDANWNASVGAVKYYLDVATDIGFTSFVVGYQNKDIGNVTTFNISGLSAGTNYYYRVRAFNVGGTSNNSNTISLITISPAPIANNAINISQTSFDANWNVTAGASGYFLDVVTDNGFTSFVPGYQNRDVGNVTSFSITGLAPGATYYYQLRAYNNSGVSNNSNIVGVMTLCAIPVATNATNIRQNSFVANWDASIGAEKYFLDLATDSLFTNFIAGFNNKDVGSITTLSITNLTEKTSYFYRIRAYNASGVTVNSNRISVNTLPSYIIISGNAGTSNVLLSYHDGTDKTVIADGAGNFSISVSYGWCGTITPNALGVTFSPNCRTCTNLTNDLTNQNFTASVNTYSLAITSANGTVNKNPDLASYTHGMPVQITATPATGYTFTGWSGDASGSANPLTVTMTSNKSIIANYSINTYALAITSENGSVTKNPDQANYNHGSTVQLSASPSAGFTFTGWSGDAGGSANPITVTMDGNKNIIANYSISTYALTVTSGNGTVIKNPDQTSYNHGSSVQLTATPATGYTFTGWSGDASSSANPLTVTMDGNKNITANYSINTYTLAVTSVNGTVAKNPDQANYNYGSTVQLTASPATGYTFSGWSGDASGSENPLTVIMNGNKNITANYSIKTYTITITSANGTVTKEPNLANYNHGTLVKLTATPSEGYKFLYWLENEITISTSSVLQFEITSNRVLVASYEKVNHAPAFVKFMHDTTINVHNTQVAFNYQYQATDPDGDIVKFNLDSGPEGATLNSSGLFSWIPKISQAGQQFLVVVTITDGKLSETKISSLNTNPVIVSVEKISDAVPTVYKLYQNYPNPFNPTTKIQFDLPKEGVVRLTVYNSIGQEVGILVNQELSAGKYSKNFDASQLSNGIYFFRLETKDFVLSKKMILVK